MGRLTLKGFGTDLLDPFDLELASGECVTLSGPSGSGKSRLLRAIADLDPHAGEARCDDTAQQALSGPAWRRQVALLPAESTWWSDRVEDHFEQLDAAALESLKLPTEASGWEVSRLSSGERQRLALLRVLNIRPKVLLLDEPTANLDQASIERVESLLERWRREHDTAVLWVTHDPEQSRRVSQRALRIDGRNLVPV